MKYCIDKIVAVLLLLISSPIFVLIAISIIIESFMRGEKLEIFTSEERCSAGKNFRILKFRIVHLLALRRYFEGPDHRSIKALELPEHLTCIGAILKKYYLDELPQLINVAIGQMSIVGPRPFYVGDLKLEPRLYNHARKLLKAGLFGPVQAAKGEVSDLEGKNSLDMAYLKICTSESVFGLLWADIKLIFRCLKTSLRGKGL